MKWVLFDHRLKTYGFSTLVPVCARLTPYLFRRVQNKIILFIYIYKKKNLFGWLRGYFNFLEKNCKKIKHSDQPGEVPSIYIACGFTIFSLAQFFFLVRTCSVLFYCRKVIHPKY